MQTHIQFKQVAESEQQKAVRALAPEQAFDRAFNADFANLPFGALGKGSSYRSTPVDNYLIGRNLIAGAGENPTWFQTTSGRIGTRLVSRGIFGAIAFTAAQNYAGRSMRNYDPNSIQSFTEWRQALVNTRSISSEPCVNQPNTMQAIAKVYDVAAGIPIKAVAKIFAPKGHEAEWATKSVLFRQRTMHKDPISTHRNDTNFRYRSSGRSVGAEAVSVTADFAAASFGDSLARNIIDTIDPNNKKARKEWQDENGHFSVANFGVDWAKRMWRIVSFNQGEDWAVALPYVYFIKWHRNVIDHFSPGFKVASDNPSWQAASDKLHATYDKAGNITELKRIGDYQREGAWDLQARFTVYNVFTLMFREGYTKVSNTFSKWTEGDSWLPKVKIPENPVTELVEGAGNAMRYTAKSFIKANLYMQPAVPTFWAFRTSQSRWQASPIIVNARDAKGQTNPVLATLIPNTHHAIYDRVGRSNPHPAYQTLESKFLKDLPYVLEHKPHLGMRSNDEHVRYHPTLDGAPQKKLYVWDKSASVHPYTKGNDLYPEQNRFSLFSAVTQPLGKASFKSGTWISGAINGAGDTTKWLTDKLLQVPSGANPLQTRWNRERSVRTAVDASFSYTPYMITKAETALRWDNQDMDRAAYRLIDGVVSFNIDEVKKAIHDISGLIRHPKIRQEGAPDTNLAPIDASIKPGTKIAGGDVAHAALRHPEHRTIQ